VARLHHRRLSQPSRCPPTPWGIPTKAVQRGSSSTTTSTSSHPSPIRHQNPNPSHQYKRFLRQRRDLPRLLLRHLLLQLRLPARVRGWDNNNATRAEGQISSTDGTCGGTASCLYSGFGDCCFECGFCGSSAACCGAGCHCRGSLGAAMGATSCPSAWTAGVRMVSLARDLSLGIAARSMGYCGSGATYCGQGCQTAFGTCQ
jgi:hypothetical protein